MWVYAMKLEIKENHFYMNQEPFFWLGDTAWLIFEKLSLTEAKRYLNNRKSLGFTVIQCVLLHTYQNGSSCAGKSPHTMEYWNEVKEVIAYANSLKLVMGILPFWGAMLKNNIITSDNIDCYTAFLNQFFKENENIVWILGGDIRGDTYFKFYDAFGKKLKQANPSRLITFHPFGRTASYQWFNACDWIDFHMFQSGHRRYDQVCMNAWDDKTLQDDVFGEDNYKYVMKNQAIIPFKPCLDGEPSYEGIPQGLHNPLEPYWQAKDVRRYAYWSVLEGACGFTYGNNAVMQFYRKQDKEGSYGVKEEWEEALYMPGAQQMHHLKNLMLYIDFIHGTSRSDIVINPKPFYEHIACFGNSHYVICYTFLGKKFALNLEHYSNLKGYWINPENGKIQFLGDVKTSCCIEFIPPMRKKEENDWVLLLVNENEEFSIM